MMAAYFAAPKKPVVYRPVLKPANDNRPPVRPPMPANDNRLPFRAEPRRRPHYIRPRIPWRWLGKRVLPKLDPITAPFSLALDIWDVWNYSPNIDGGYYPQGYSSHWGPCGVINSFSIGSPSLPPNYCGVGGQVPSYAPGEDGWNWGDPLPVGGAERVTGMNSAPIVPGMGPGFWRGSLHENWEWDPNKGPLEIPYWPPKPVYIPFSVPWAKPWPMTRPWSPPAEIESGYEPYPYKKPWEVDHPSVIDVPTIEFNPNRNHPSPVTDSPHKMGPPGPGVKERKPRASAGFVGAIMDALGKMDEVNQFIDAIYKALPNRMIWFKGRDGKWHMRHFGPFEKAAFIYQHLGDVDLNKALWNIAKNELQDRAFGYAGRQLNRALRHAVDAGYYRGAQGFQGGNYLRP